jgi:chemosensory pili system protein ChpA (sensor histidine kinase/response regulator)
MDAVRAEIRSLGGTVTAETSIVKTEYGERAYEQGGTQFTIRVPFTMAGNKALLVEAMGELWAVPYQAVDGVIQLNTWELQEYYNDPTAKLESGGQHYNLCYLPSLLGGESSPNFDEVIESDDNAYSNSDEKTVLLIHGVQPPCALHVDKLIANRELLVKPVGKLLDNIPGLQGSSVLGNGDIALVLNIPALLHSETPAQKLQSSETLERPTKEPETPKLALVIDDSATARSLATRLLEGQGYAVVCAAHGQEALDKLQAMAELPSLILLDIDMPVMDGYTFAEKMTKNAVFTSIPVIVASSREGEEHQRRLADLRTQGALVKPYGSAELEQALQQLNQVIIFE